MNNNKSKIIFSGGGTGGPVTPLLVVAQKYLESEPKTTLVFIGTKTGPEREMVANSGLDIRFIAIFSGKWRRYFSLLNFWDGFKIIVAFIQSIFILLREKPKLIVSAGGFVSVPIVWAASITKTPVLIHQQDVRPGLANRLMAPFAKVVTTTFAKSLQDYGPKAVWVGNPVIDLSPYVNKLKEIDDRYKLKKDQALVLVVGGGTGAQGINNLVFSGLNDLTSFCQLIHLTGSGKSKPLVQNNYQSFDFLPYPEVLALLARADLVVSRCGLGFLTELSALAKASILIPLPHSHQEDNANFFRDKEAAVVLNQLSLDVNGLVLAIKNTLQDQSLLKKIKNNISMIIKKEASEQLVKIMKEIINS